jgi:hypothetical protein
LSISRHRRAFVVGAYLPNGGTRMAWHVGRILELDFGVPVTAVTVADETPDHGIHAYDLAMPRVSLTQMEQEIGADDILVANPSYSSHTFGLRLPGFKLCYVQGFSTYDLLDLKFDHYVAVSDFVAEFLRPFGVAARVIPAFVELDDLPAAPEWAQRPALTVLPYRKGLAHVWDASFTRLRERVAQRAPEIEFAEALASADVPHHELLARLGSARYLLSLSAAEGFGLVPLEAMAMGTLVCGYDGFGGRQYMRPGENCAVAPYPDVDLVAERLIAAVCDPQSGAQMAQRGRETAAHYSYAAFRRAWIDELRQALRIEPVT